MIETHVPSRRRSRLTGVASVAIATGVAIAVAAATPVAAQTCGDVNGTNTVTVADALRVLKVSVGQDVVLTCSGDCETLEPRVTELEDALASTQASLSDAEDLLAETSAALSDVQALLEGVSRTDSAIVISGANLQVVDGSGNTAGATNGLGNIIIGYNEGTAETQRTGSHNLIVGIGHAWTSFSGIVAGENNLISARAACVLGGKDNQATQLYSSVCGGSDNTASGQYASVGGGFSNTASGTNAAISGGCENSATNTYSAVSGGQAGVASGFWSSVTGGFTNKATAEHSAVSGGSTHTASTQFNWKAGSLSEAQ